MIYLYLFLSDSKSIMKDDYVLLIAFAVLKR